MKMIGLAEHTPKKWNSASPCHDATPRPQTNRVALCQATLSIGLYLLLEGPVPTHLFIPRYHETQTCI